MALQFTAPNGSTISVDGRDVVRVRRTVHGENKAARTRLDAPPIMQLVLEPLDVVVAAVRLELTSLAMLTGRDGSQIWFDAKKARGPVTLIPGQHVGVNSSIVILSYRQYVRETDDEVRAVLEAGRNAT